MSFPLYLAQYHRHYHDSNAWKLLRTKNSPYILAFMLDVFGEEREVDFEQAKLLLDGFIEYGRENGNWQTDKTTSQYLNEWTKEGWLREMDNRLTLTDASDMVLRFCRQFDERISATTASHLRKVQNEIKEFSIALSDDMASKIQELKKQQQAIEKQITDIEAGIYLPLSEYEQQERIKEIYRSSSQLTGDFRLMEERIRKLDKELRINMIADGHSFGDVMAFLLKQEELLSQTEAGNALTEFFKLLSDENYNNEFREHLNRILSHSASQYLTSKQKHYLSNLIKELNKEADRVLKIRRRTTDEFNRFIQSGAMSDVKVVDKLIAQLEQKATKFNECHIDLQTPLNIHLLTGNIQINSPDKLKLRQADETLNMGETIVQLNQIPSDDILKNIELISLKHIAKQMKPILAQYGTLSLAQLSQYLPIQSGLEGLVAYVRIAKMLNATEIIGQKEDVLIYDKYGIAIQANIPILILSEELFVNIDELSF